MNAEQILSELKMRAGMNVATYCLDGKWWMTDHTNEQLHGSLRRIHELVEELDRILAASTPEATPEPTEDVKWDMMFTRIVGGLETAGVEGEEERQRIAHIVHRNLPKSQDVEGEVEIEVGSVAEYIVAGAGVWRKDMAPEYYRVNLYYAAQEGYLAGLAGARRGTVTDEGLHICIAAGIRDHVLMGEPVDPTVYECVAKRVRDRCAGAGPSEKTFTAQQVEERERAAFEAGVRWSDEHWDYRQNSGEDTGTFCQSGFAAYLESRTEKKEEEK